MKELDVRGLSCPEPVLLLQEKINEDKQAVYKVITNEPHTVKNLKKFAEGCGKKVTIKEIGLEYELIIE